MDLTADRRELSRARMPLGHFAAAVGLTHGRIAQMRAEGAIVGAKRGRGFDVDVRATLLRCGRPEWVWVGDGSPDGPTPASLSDGWIEVPAAAAVAVAAMVAREVGKDPAAAAAPVAEAEGVTAGDYYTGRARRELANAALAEIRLAEARREAIPATAVRGYCGRVGTMVRERVLAVENASLTRMDAAAQLWLAGELRAALTFLADALDREGAGLLDGSVAEVEDAPDEAPA